MTTYTKLTCEIKGASRGDDTEISVIKESWDLTLGELFSMMKSLALALDYHPDTVAEYFEAKDFNGLEQDEYELTKAVIDNFGNDKKKTE
jgi:hypothetical protein